MGGIWSQARNLNENTMRKERTLRERGPYGYLTGKLKIPKVMYREAM